MNENAERAVRRALLPRLRLQTAQLELLGLPAGNEEALADWLASLPGPLRADQDPIAEMGVTVSGDFARWRWWAAGSPGAFIPAMATYLPSMGAARAELDRLSALGPALQPAQLGYWLEQRPDGLNAGWYVPEGVWLADARPALPEGSATDTVLAWAAEYGVRRVARLGRSMGKGSPYAELALALPTPRDVEGQVYAATQLFERLKALRPPDAALGLLMNLEQTGLAVSVWLTGQGPVKVGLLAAQPRLTLTLELLRLAGGEAAQQTALAALQGILGVEEPAQVECATRAAGFGVELHYRLDLEAV